MGEALAISAIVISLISLFISIRSYHFASSPRFEIKLEAVDRITGLELSFANIGDVPLRAELDFYTATYGSKFSKEIRSSRPILDETKSYTQLNILGHLEHDVPPHNQVARYVILPDLQQKWRMHSELEGEQYSHELFPNSSLRVEGIYYSAMESRLFRRKWKYKRIFHIQYIMDQDKWIGVVDSFRK